MRKKFVQTLAAQQLELSSHIRTHDMELEKESSARAQRTQSGSGPEDVIEIMDDDQEVELMMERHRKYHPRKYVNLQQPTSKVYYDKIDAVNTSPALDREDRDMEEEDEGKLVVIDCAKDGPQTKEPNNNSANAPNGNYPTLDSNGELAGPISLPPKPKDSPSDRTKSDDQQTAASGYSWHVPQSGGKHAELRQHILKQREKMLHSRPDTPAPVMFQKQPPQPYGSPNYQRSQRAHPYERQTSGSSSTTSTPCYSTPLLHDGRNTAIPHPRASQPQGSPTVGGIQSGISLGAGEGRKSAFSTPQEKRHHDAIMMPPPPTLTGMPGSASSVAIAPRTPFYHPYVPPYHYSAYGATTPSASTYHTLEEWYRAGYPPPHLLSPTELQYYYHCYLSKIVFSAPGYHPHDQHYRDYSSLAMTPGTGTAYYPPPQYGFAKPAANSAVVVAPTTNVAAPSSAAGADPAVGGGVKTVPSAYPAHQPIDFSPYNNDRNVPSLSAGFLPTTLPSATAETMTEPRVSLQQQPSHTASYSSVSSTLLHYTAPQAEAIRPTVISSTAAAAAATQPAKKSPTAAQTSSLMSPPASTTMPPPQPPANPSPVVPSSTTPLSSALLSPTTSLPSSMLSPSSMPSPTRHPAPPPSMPSLSSTLPLSPKSQPTASTPTTTMSAPTPYLSPSSMMPPPSRHPPPSMPSLSSTMPPPAPPSATSPRRTLSDMPKLPPPPSLSSPTGALRNERTDPRADLPPSVGKFDTKLNKNPMSDVRSDSTSKVMESNDPSAMKHSKRFISNKLPGNFGSRYERPTPPPPPPPPPSTPKRRGRGRPPAASHNKAPSQRTSSPQPSGPAVSPANHTGERNIGALLQQMRREMMSFLQQRRSDIISTMRIYTIGRIDFGGFLVEMKRHSVTYRDFMHVAFTLMRRCGYGGFAMEPPAELDYRWKNPPQEFADYFAKNEHCSKQFVADNFDFLLLIVDNLLQQYFEPMEFFLLTYVLGLRAK
ncbi:nascent polypeptide-associated complex subunit alpha, muscle-specific form-like [Anopheles moucheti]|uniref:nascent polypeptide-associated complex subunit alpha, muscle-specific form-like n=1 Tax=Anopheles moucheti TaxID=186751 RepID=UPI0022F01822|nr:nascent polypeptide-associated complex subunit alpha, muscle-specific form-like [Anopheles moucheti]